MTHAARLAGITLTLCLFTATAFAQNDAGDKKAPPNAEKKASLPLCPVSGEEVNFRVSVEMPDGPVYLCCGGCKEKLNKDASAYTDAIRKQRDALRDMPRVQVSCPLTGAPVNPKISTEKDGAKVSFCGEGCKTAYEAEPAKYASKLASAYTYQARCPVMNAKIKPNIFVTLPDGERIYLCCGMCDGKFIRNPDRYADKLASQGYRYEAGTLKTESLNSNRPEKDDKPDADEP